MRRANDSAITISARISSMQHPSFFLGWGARVSTFRGIIGESGQENNKYRMCILNICRRLLLDVVCRMVSVNSKQ